MGARDVVSRFNFIDSGAAGLAALGAIAVTALFRLIYKIVSHLV